MIRNLKNNEWLNMVDLCEFAEMINWMYWFKYPITRWGVYLAGVTEYSDTSGYFEIWYQNPVFYFLEIICNDIY